jgi:hypothetical protein
LGFLIADLIATFQKTVHFSFQIFASKVNVRSKGLDSCAEINAEKNITKYLVRILGL